VGTSAYLLGIRPECWVFLGFVISASKYGTYFKVFQCLCNLNLLTWAVLDRIGRLFLAFVSNLIYLVGSCVHISFDVFFPCDFLWRMGVAFLAIIHASLGRLIHTIFGRYSFTDIF
jgi:hypothetical protein